MDKDITKSTFYQYLAPINFKKGLLVNIPGLSLKKQNL